MKYLLYEPEDFAADEFFSGWVLYPTPVTESFWQEWLQKNPDRRKDIEIARQLVLIASSDTGKGASEFTRDRIWQAVLAGRQNNRFSLRYGNLWIKAAAVISLLILALGGYLYTKERGQVFRTAFGESRRLALPDGSHVTLNANSYLKVSQDWHKAGFREVWLEGEAFFEVSKINKKGLPLKFVVHTHDLNVEVKGTQFNVNTRKDQTQVVLSEGLIHLLLKGNESGKQILMKPGDLVDFSANRQQFSIRHLPDAAPIYSWKDNRWTLNDTSLEEIAVLIQETYGVAVSIGKGDLGDQKVTGVVPTDNLDDLLNSLESILPVTIRRNENQVTIQNR